MKEFICQHCQAVFLSREWYSRRGGNKFCSRICYFGSEPAKRRKKLPLVSKICETCNTAFLFPKRKQRFCSRPCSYIGRVKKRFDCLNCGEKTKSLQTKFCSKKCMMSGRFNSHWKGGITTENRKLRNSDKYAEWRIKVFLRDCFTCVLCRKVGEQLNADHIKPWAFYPELRFVISNGRTLCKACHEKKPKRFKDKAAYLIYESKISNQKRQGA